MKLDEGGLARVVKRAKDKSQSHATVSAERGDKSKKENKSRSKQLEKDLRGRGYGPKKTTGTYSEKDDKTGEEKKVKERSYFVTSGKKSKRRFKKDMKKVAAKHNQDSVLVKQKGSSTAKLHATRKGGLGKSKSETAGKLKAKKGEFSTQVGKKHMTYEESISAKGEMTREQIREGVLNQLKKGTKRHKDAVEKKKIKNRKAVPYAALAAGHEPEGEMVDEKISASGYARAKKWREDQARAKDKKEQEHYANKAKTHKWDGEKWNKKENVNELKFGEKGKTFFYNDPKARRDALNKTGKDPGMLDGAKEYATNKAKEIAPKAVKAAKSVAAPAIAGGVVGAATAPKGKKVQGAIGGGSGSAVGAKIGASGGPVGAAVGAAVGGAVGSLVATGGKAKKSKKEGYYDWRSDEALMEKVGGSGTLVRQGVKFGGKKGGRAVQAGQSKAITAGKGAKESAKGGNKSKMVGDGKFEKAGAVVGGVTGGVAGAIVDGPLPIGDIVGGIAGAKVGGKIGRQIDKIGTKKVKKENMMYQHPFGKFSGMV